MIPTFLLLVLVILTGRIDPVDSAVSFQLICPDAHMEAVAGHPVTLKCSTKPELEVERVEWTVNGTEVHLFRHGEDDYNNQNEKYRGKTTLFKDELYRGNSSLNLTADMSHSGDYCCFVRARSVYKKCYITVNVHPEEEEGTSKKKWNDPNSTDDPNYGTDGLTKIPQDNCGLIAIVIGGLVLTLTLVIYFCRNRLKQLCSQRNSRNPPTHPEASCQAQQDEGNEPADPKPNEEQDQMTENENQDGQKPNEEQILLAVMDQGN